MLKLEIELRGGRHDGLRLDYTDSDVFYIETGWERAWGYRYAGRTWYGRRIYRPTGDSRPGIRVPV